MKCPNPKCSCKKFLPAEANFCPECGTQLHSEKAVHTPNSPINISTDSTTSHFHNTIAPKFEIKYCVAYPAVIKSGEKSVLKWSGDDVKYIKIDGTDYSPHEYIYLSPKSTKEYKVYFISNSNKVCSHSVQVVVERASRIIFLKQELSRINAYDSGLDGLVLRLNGEHITHTEMRPYCQKEIVVKKGDVVELVTSHGSVLFSKTITDDILSKSTYYLEYVKKMWVIGEVEFRAV